MQADCSASAASIKEPDIYLFFSFSKGSCSEFVLMIEPGELPCQSKWKRCFYNRNNTNQKQAFAALILCAIPHIYLLTSQFCASTHHHNIAPFSFKPSCIVSVTMSNVNTVVIMAERPSRPWTCTLFVCFFRSSVSWSIFYNTSSGRYNLTNSTQRWTFMA